VVVTAGAVGAAVRLGQRRRQPRRDRLALEQQRRDTLGDRCDQLPLRGGRVSASSWVSGASRHQLPRCVSSKSLMRNTRSRRSGAARVNLTQPLTDRHRSGPLIHGKWLRW
jgi:hypothetical protein